MQGKLSPVVVNSYQPLREIVCEVLRDAIRGGVLKPGEWLKENDLADELLVSRTPVREAIRKLEQEGYVVTVPRRGAYVASVSIRDINEIFEIRSALEALACELAAERITDEEQERLERLLVAIGRAIEERDMDRIVQTDIEFHELLYQAARDHRQSTGTTHAFSYDFHVLSGTPKGDTRRTSRHCGCDWLGRCSPCTQGRCKAHGKFGTDIALRH